MGTTKLLLPRFGGVTDVVGTDPGGADWLAPFSSSEGGPASFVAAEIHRGLAIGGICGGRSQRNIQVACQFMAYGKANKFRTLSQTLEVRARQQEAKIVQTAQKSAIATCCLK